MTRFHTATRFMRRVGPTRRLGPVLAAGLAALCAFAQEQPQLPDAAVAAVMHQQELELALEAANQKIKQLEAKLALRDEKDVPVEAALAEANREAEKFRQLYRDLQLRVEELGLETIRSDKALQDRLIKAVRERQMFKERNNEAYEQLLRLSEAVMDYVKSATAGDPEARLRVEAELRKTDELLGMGGVRKLPVRNVDINDGQVISFKDELRLAVLNIGRRSGVRVGMPLEIQRKDRVVGTALVVDVRDSISGAVVQQLFREGDRIQIRDRVKPKTTGKNLNF